MSALHTTEKRMLADRKASFSLLRLICIASLIRTSCTRLLPLAGASSWWILILCLAPGIGVCLLLGIGMRVSRTGSLTELARCCFGRAGAWLASLTLALLLLTEASAALQALIVLFTEGVGTRGTTWSLALLTLLAVLLAIHVRGLPRGVFLLRWPMTAALLLLAACSVPHIRLDRLFPLAGEGLSALAAALQAGYSLGWPLALLFTEELSVKGSRWSSVVGVSAVGAGCLLLLSLTIPHALLLQTGNTAEALLIAFRLMPPSLQLLGQCLMMLLLFLTICGCVRLCVSHLCAPIGRTPVLLPAAAALLLLTQIGAFTRVLPWMGSLERWLLAPLSVLAVFCLAVAPFRRKRR